MNETTKAENTNTTQSGNSTGENTMTTNTPNLNQTSDTNPPAADSPFVNGEGDRFDPPTLAYEWDGLHHAGWLMSEKLDGVRAIWTGERLVTRNNTLIRAPREWLLALKASVGSRRLDGELFIAPRRFEDTMSIVRGPNETNGRWSEIRFMVFDVMGPGNYASRMSAVRTLATIGQLPKFITLVEQRSVTSPDALQEFLNSILLKSGEGVMLRDPNAAYEHRRSRGLQKVKMFYDAEGEVVGFVPGKGQFAGVPGALLLKVGDQVVRVGSGMVMAQRTAAKLGDVVTFRFTEKTKHGAYRFPVFVRFRNEMI